MLSTDLLVPILQEWIGAFMSRSMRSLNLYLKENDLSMSQIGALFQINRGRINVSDLGEGLGISNAAASQMLERLVQQGLILRSEDSHDRRAKKLALTEKGCRVIHDSVMVRKGLLEDLVLTLSEGEKEQITTAIKILIDKTKQLEHRSEPER